MLESNRITSNPGITYLAFFAASSLVLCVPAFAQQTPRCGTDPVTFSQAFLKAIYPELKETKARLSISATGPFERPWPIHSQFSVEVTRFAPGHEPAGVIHKGVARPYVDHEQVGGGFFCSSNHFLLRFSATGAVLHTTEREKLDTESNAHPEWTDEELLRALKTAGARYGPDRKDAFLNQAPLKALEPYIGPFKVVSVEFKLREPEREGSFTRLDWAVQVDAQQGTDRVRYVLLFEPFGGNLYHLFRLDSAPSDSSK